MEHAREYFKALHGLIERIETSQLDNLTKAASAMAESVARGGVIHIFGCGHTQILALETWFRAGQPACISPVFDAGLWPQNGPAKGSDLERLPGYGTVIARNHDVQSGEVAIVISNSGRNPTPIEVALNFKQRGLTVVAVTSLDYALTVTSKHESGRRLHEVADIVVDNAGPAGDALMEIPDGRRAAPVTTITNAAILGALLLEMDYALHQRGVEPPVFTSANLDVDLRRNAEYAQRYSNRVKYYKG